MIPKIVWNLVHGMDCEYKSILADVDLCMRIREAGYLVLWTPFTELCYQQKQRCKAGDLKKKKPNELVDSKRFNEKWSNQLIDGDPYNNLNMMNSKAFNSKEYP